MQYLYLFDTSQRLFQQLLYTEMETVLMYPMYDVIRSRRISKIFVENYRDK